MNVAFSVLLFGIFALCGWCVYRFFKKKRPKDKKKEKGKLDEVTQQRLTLFSCEYLWSFSASFSVSVLEKLLYFRMFTRFVIAVKN